VAKEFAGRGIVAESGEELLGFFENLPALEHAAEFEEPEKVHVRMDRGQMMSTLAIDIEIPALASAPA